LFVLQQGKISEAEKAVKKLYGKEIVASVMQDLTAASQGSSEPEAGWSELFSSRYRKGNAKIKVKTDSRSDYQLLNRFLVYLSIILATEN